ncbi:MAG: OmpA family protein, partial [Alphaproteobacteria bacterium]|nr:OmpA family protein [Alphaproteobacteria bacterium]
PMTLRITPRLSLIASLCLLTACTTASLEELRRTTPTGDAFQAALAQEYLAFSESEARQYDWSSSKRFADKGLKSAYGQPVAPENIAAWKIGGAFVNELSNAREQLMGVLTPELTTAYPQLTARAQFFYDCWLEQQEEAWQEDDITSCREGFYRSVKTLLATMEPEPQAEPMAEPVAPMIFSSSYIVFFEWNKFVLTTDAIGIINTVADDLKTSQEEKYEVILNGHADRSGTPEYNLQLSKKRAEAVKAALIERGIPAERIQYYAFGETDNRIPTKDNIREHANRRVEIFFNQ